MKNSEQYHDNNTPINNIISEILFEGTEESNSYYPYCDGVYYCMTVGNALYHFIIMGVVLIFLSQLFLWFVHNWFHGSNTKNRVKSKKSHHDNDSSSDRPWWNNDEKKEEFRCCK